MNRLVKEGDIKSTNMNLRCSKPVISIFKFEDNLYGLAQ